MERGGRLWSSVVISGRPWCYMVLRCVYTARIGSNTGERRVPDESFADASLASLWWYGRAGSTGGRGQSSGPPPSEEPGPSARAPPSLDSSSAAHRSVTSRMRSFLTSFNHAAGVIGADLLHLELLHLDPVGGHRHVRRPRTVRVGALSHQHSRQGRQVGSRSLSAQQATALPNWAVWGQGNTQGAAVPS